MRWALASVLLLTAACSDDAAPAPAASSSRVNAVMANEHQRPLDAFCDVYAHADQARPMSTPPLSEGHSLAAATPGRWRWINVWATWCRPCVEEFARIAGFRDRLAAEGSPADLQFLSVDQAQSDVDQFVVAHAEARGSARLSDAGAIPALLAALGLDPGASIPIHVFVDPANKIRCVRVGAVDEDDFDLVKRVLHGE
jgi:thiol-disulfide isomerase/thioredoxin